MKPGDLRRFHDDAFYFEEKHLNGKTFMIFAITHHSFSKANYATILVDECLIDDWSLRILEDYSDSIDLVQRPKDHIKKRNVTDNDPT